MADLSVPNAAPGVCAKCHGSGEYRWWGAVVNGQATHAARCNACKGSGRQTWSDIRRNRAFNRYQLARAFT